ncbi:MULTISPECIES: helix-turn-helix domain-containing protein [Lysinibacillus]|uniref:helix-turn-helix domain-containing protein n=1 Tax=Lysinibacillus TaxID=400634 RepID=UPI002DB73C67|nr:helix-turn-helix transcriptional regulator [Lysinibacillus sphaericus]MEB7454365.1 helix-turn-helix domain-containing protein [Lysinibacillus sphaericus]WKT76890.1 helix-turn-helix transcriptional regulator [Lysinibacillus fusiformis]
MSLGERLKKARKSKGLTQEKLAEMIGTSRGVITNLEHDKIETPQPLIINALCNFLEIDQKWLLHGIGEMANEEVVKSAKILSEIYKIVKELSEEEQLYILDVIKSYREHIKKR